MRKKLSLLLILMMLVSIIGGCSNNEMGSVSGGNTDVKSDNIADNGDHYDMSEYGVIYDYDKVPDSFWNGYEYGFESYDYMNNKWAFETNLAGRIGETFGALARPRTGVTQYAEIDDVFYELQIDIYNWCFPEELSVLSDGNYSDVITAYYYTTDMRYHIIKLEVKDKNYVKGSAEGYIKTINGWEWGSNCLCQDINDDYYLQISLWDFYAEAMTEELQEELIETVANGVTFKGATEEVDFEHLVIPDSSIKIELGSNVKIDIADYYISSWHYTENNFGEYNLINLVDHNKEGIYKLSEHSQDWYANIDSFVQAEEEYYTIVEHSYNGLPLYLLYNKEIALGDHIIFSEGSFNGFVFEQNGFVYQVSIISASDVLEGKTVDDFIASLTFLEIN